MTWQPGSLVYLRRNPALGPLRVVEADGDRALVQALRGDAQRLKVGSMDLGMFPLYEGMHLEVPGADQSQVGILSTLLAHLLERDRADGLRRCRVRFEDGERWIDESGVIPPFAASHNPLDILDAAEWRGPRRFFARRGLRDALSRMYQDSDGLPTFFGARVHPLGHQLYASRRVLWNRTPRFVLADEVGLGKTIEAGYVIQALSASSPPLMVLVIAPGAMTRQWLCELYLRFGARAFTEVSATRWHSTSRPKRQQLAAQQCLIVSATAVGAYADLRELLASRSWDLLILDEAHQFPPRHPLYPWLQQLSTSAKGLLALSATPSKRETESLLGLLALVSPGSYDPRDVSALERRLADRQRIWDALHDTLQLTKAARREGQELEQEDIDSIVTTWEKAVPDDPICRELLEEIRGGNAEMIDELVGYVQEFHRIDHRLIRTRRATLDALGVARSTREGEVLDYEPTAAEALMADHLDQLPADPGMDAAQWTLRGLYSRFAATTPEFLEARLSERLRALESSAESSSSALSGELLSDPGPEEEVDLMRQLLATVRPLSEERKWLETAIGLAREWRAKSDEACERHRVAVQWLKAQLAKDRTRKLLVFSQEHAVVEEFGAYIRKSVPEAGVQLFHQGMSPEELEKVALLFQRDSKCRILVSNELGGEGRNFELAWAVLHLDAPVAVARLEQRIGRLDRMGRQSDEPVRSWMMRGPVAVERLLIQLHTEVFQVQQRSIGGLEFALPRLQQIMSDAACGKNADTAVKRLGAEVDELLRQTDEEFELSLDTSRPELEKAKESASMLEETDPADFTDDLLAWAKALGLWTNVREDTRDAKLKWEADQLEVSIPALRFDGQLNGTFSRERAFENDGLQFFGPGHRLFDVMLDALDTTPIGRATIFRRNLGSRYRDRTFVLLLARCSIRQGAPAGLAVRARRHLWPTQEEAFFAIDPNGEPVATEVTDPELLRRLKSPYQGGEFDRKVEPEELTHSLDPAPLWSAVRQVVPLALEAIRARCREQNEEAAEKLGEDLRYELGYLRGVTERGAPEEAAKAREEIRIREELLSAVKQGLVELEGLAVIIGS